MVPLIFLQLLFTLSVCILHWYVRRIVTKDVMALSRSRVRILINNRILIWVRATMLQNGILIRTEILQLWGTVRWSHRYSWPDDRVSLYIWSRISQPHSRFMNIWFKRHSILHRQSLPRLKLWVFNTFRLLELLTRACVLQSRIRYFLFHSRMLYRFIMGLLLYSLRWFVDLLSAHRLLGAFLARDRKLTL